jgi:hypothetical protein
VQLKQRPALGELGAEQAHDILVQLTWRLTYFDLGEETLPHRRWESWSAAGFHTNLLRAFQVYLSQVRHLFSPEERLDYRYLAGGRAENLLREKASWQPQNLSALQTVVEGHYIDERAEEVPRGANERAFIHHLERHVSGLRSQGGNQDIAVDDIELAARLIFMQWLTGDVLRKNEMLERIRDGLQKLEIPFRRWLIEYDNHLFSADWLLCVEPSLNTNRLVSLADCAFRLRDELHRDDTLPWDTLAAALRDHKLERVRTGAARLSSLLRIYSDLPEPLYQSITGETSHGGRPLDFGHLLLAELEREQELKDTPRAVALETSHSTWRLAMGRDKCTWPERADAKKMGRFLGRLSSYSGGADYG